MTGFVSTQIPPPDDPKEFESLCADLFGEIYNDPTAHKHGRSGQRQQGVDIVVTLEGGAGYLGIQCKTRGQGKKITERELREEVRKARDFEPAIKNFILATTALTDAKIQKVARKITEEHRKEGLFSVSVSGWDEIKRKLDTYRGIRAKYYEDPHGDALGEILEQVKDSTKAQEETQTGIDAIKGDLASGNAETKFEFQSLHAKIDSLSSGFIQTKIVSGGGYPVDKEINAQIDNCLELLRENKPSAALNLLEKLKVRVWDSASNYVKFRITTNIAVAYLEKGESSIASENFIAAFGYNPDDEKAICNLALGYLIAENYKKAKSTTQEAITAFPNSSRAYSLLIASLQHEEYPEDPSAIVPPELLEKTEVAYHLAQFFYSKREYEVAHKWINKVLSGSKKDIEVRSLAAVILLTPFINDSKIAPNKQLEKGRSLLWELWEEIKDRENVSQIAHISINLANVELAIGDVDTAVEVVCKGLESNPNLDDLKRLKVAIELERGNFQDALDVSKGIDVTQHQDIVILQSTALVNLKKFDESLQKLETISSDSTHVLYGDANALRLRIKAEKGEVDEAIADADEFLASNPKNVAVTCALAQIYVEAKDRQNAKVKLSSAKSLICDSTHYRYRKLVAELFYTISEYQDALSLYEGYISTERDSHELRNMLVCLVQLEQRSRVLGILEQLDENTKNQSFYLNMAGFVYHQTGEIEKARAKYEQYLGQDPESLEARLDWIMLCEKLGEGETVKDFLANIDTDNFANSNPECLVALARFFVIYGFVEQGLKLAYENRRKNYDHPAAHQGYILIFSSIQTGDFEALDRTDIGKDMSFTLKGENGVTTTYTIESSGEIDRRFGEIAPTDPIVVNTTGKKKGEKVCVPINEAQADTYKIVEVQHKYVYAMQQSMLHFNEMFPENHGLTRYKLEDSDIPEERLRPILNALERRREYVLDIVQEYASKGYPLAVVATQLGSHPIDTWKSFAVREDISLQVCVGTTGEYRYASDLIESNKGAFIIDPVTLFSIHVLDVQDAVVEVIGKIGIVQSTIDLLEELVVSKGKNVTGYMGKGDEGYYMHEVSEQEIQDEIDQSKRVMAWAKSNCEILPAVGGADIPPQLIKMKELMAPAFIDTMLASQGTGRVLLSDDMHYRQWAKQLFGIDGVWLQPILMAAQKQGAMTTEIYCKNIVKLVASKYDFTSVNADVLLYVAEKSG